MHPQKEIHAGVCGQTIDPASSSAPRLFSKTVPFTLTHRNRLFVLLLVTTSAWFWQPLVELVSLTQREEHYSHMLLIPWVSLYVFYLDRTAILESKEWSPWLGSLLLGAGALSYGVNKPMAWGADHLSLTMLAFVVMCWGIFLFCFGKRCFRRMSFGLLFLLFLVPLPSVVLQSIIGFLQRSSAEATSLLFSILGIPVFRQGFLFSLSNFTIHVAEQCSGIRSALSLVLTSVLAGHFFLRSSWGKTSIVAIVIPLAIIKNAFRIVGLALLANYVDPTYITDSLLHRAGGIPLFLLSLIVLFSFVWLVRRLENRWV
ncbi:MAG: exosortase/archaeosortase family protein [Nitrospira sp.]